MFFESLIFNLLPIIIGLLVVAMVFESRPSLLNGLLSNPDIDADSAENSVE